MLIRPETFQAVNGFSNQFWGWGHEDNELYVRMRACGMAPQHAPGIQWCMEHKDCDQCKRAKPKKTLNAMREETRNIALLQSLLEHDSARYKAVDGLSSVNFTAAARSTTIACGGHVLHALDIRLNRERHVYQRCDENGEPCVEPFPVKQLPKALTLRAKRALPAGVRARHVLRATRERAFYNLHYELDIEVDANAGGPRLYRIAVCAQEWRRDPDAGAASEACRG